MNVTYACSSCDAAARQEFDEQSTTLACPACRHEITLPEGAVSGERVRRCLVCPSHDLYMRKDFPQRLGVLLVGIGIVALIARSWI